MNKNLGRYGTSPDPRAPENRRYVEGQQLYLHACDPRRSATVVINNETLESPFIVAAARSSAQSVDAVVAQSLERTIPPHLAALLPTALRAEPDAMEHLSERAAPT